MAVPPHKALIDGSVAIREPMTASCPRPSIGLLAVNDGTRCKAVVEARPRSRSQPHLGFYRTPAPNW